MNPTPPPCARAPFYTVTTYETATSVGFVMGRCLSRLVDGIDAALAQGGITAQQFGVLHDLLTGRARSPSALARVGDRYSGTVTYLLDGLQRKQLLVRTRSAGDRRVIELRLTPEGEQTTRDGVPRVVQAHNRFLDGLTRDEHETLTRLLSRLAEGPPAAPLPPLDPPTARRP